MKIFIIIPIILIMLAITLVATDFNNVINKNTRAKEAMTDITQVTEWPELVDAVATPHFNAKTIKTMWLITNIHASATLNGNLTTEFKRGEEVECNIIDTTAYIHSYNEDGDAACEYQVPLVCLSNKPPTK